MSNPMNDTNPECEKFSKGFQEGLKTGSTGDPALDKLIRADMTTEGTHTKAVRVLSPAQAQARKAKLAQEILDISRGKINFVDTQRLPFGKEDEPLRGPMGWAGKLSGADTSGPYFASAFSNNHFILPLCGRGKNEIMALRDLRRVVTEKYWK